MKRQRRSNGPRSDHIHCSAVIFQCLIAVIHTQASRSNPKQVWLLSIDLSSPDITEAMLADCGLRNAVQEIHSMQYKDSKYVLLNLNRKARIRLQQMKSTVDQLDQKFGTSGARIIADETSMLQRMMKAMDDGNGAVKSWRADSGRQQKTKIGFLRRAVGELGGEVESSNKYKRLKMLYLATKRKLDSVMKENDALKTENNTLRETRVILVSN